MSIPQIRPGVTRIGFVGTGIMGGSMAGHLQNGGYAMYVYSRTQSKADKLLQKGAVWCGSAGEVARQSDVVFTIVGFPRDVREIYLAKGGIVECARPGTVLCDMTTSEPSLACEIFAAAHQKDVWSLDAPVSGGDVGAREARLTIMVGGPKEAFDAALTLFQLMGKSINHMGEAGAGQHTKMCNQIAIAGNMLSALEALRYAKQANLDQRKMVEAIQGGAAGSWTLQNLIPRVLAGNFAPGFMIQHFRKDLEIAVHEAERMHLSMPALTNALAMYRKAEAAGGGSLGTQGLYKLWEEHPDW